eukprot:g3375.t1
MEDISPDEWLEIIGYGPEDDLMHSFGSWMPIVDCFFDARSKDSLRPPARTCMCRGGYDPFDEEQLDDYVDRTPLVTTILAEKTIECILNKLVRPNTDYYYYVVGKVNLIDMEQMFYKACMRRRDGRVCNGMLTVERGCYECRHCGLIRCVEAKSKFWMLLQVSDPSGSIVAHALNSAVKMLGYEASDFDLLTKSDIFSDVLGLMMSKTYRFLLKIRLHEIVGHYDARVTVMDVEDLSME